ncbi:MAG: uroporphyrinogen-III C-methyltransferase [Gammaproteobacteria bacterium]
MTDAEKQELHPDASEQQQAAPSPEERSEATTQSAAHSTPSQAPLLAALLAILLALGGLSLGYLKWVDLNSSLQQELQDISTLKQKQLEIKGQLDESSQSIAAQDELLKQERAQLEQKTVEMQQALDGVFQRIGRSSNQWIVAEAEYLMRIANHRLQLEGDVATALIALKTADERLRDTGDPVWTGVRERLATEMAELKAVNALDLEGQAAKLSGLISQVAELKLPHSGPVVAASSQEVAAKTKEFTLESVLRDGWEGFKSLMVIRHNERPLTAMLGPEQRFFLYQNLRLQLEAARLALLRRDQRLYDSSLQRAKAWIGEFFDQGQAVAKAMQTEIDELSGLELQTKLPDISGSLRLLQQQQDKINEEQKAGS